MATEVKTSKKLRYCTPCGAKRSYPHPPMGEGKNGRAFGPCDLCGTGFYLNEIDYELIEHVTG